MTSGSLEERARLLSGKARRALESDACDRTPCGSKAAVLALIKSGDADMMVVNESTFWIEFPEAPLRQHIAIRFHDRTLGDAARELSLDGFNLR